MTFTIHPTADWGAVLAFAGAALVWMTRQGTLPAALWGLLVALVATAAFGAGAFVPLAVFVLGSGALTRTGREIKEERCAAEANAGRRGAAHVLAKLTVPAVASALAIVRAAPADALALVYTASLVGAFADTAATELGPLRAGAAWKLRGAALASVPHGTPGAVSAAGLLAGALSALLLGAGSYAAAVVGPRAAAAGAAAGFAATLLESALAGTKLGERAGHHGRNLFLSVASAGIALSARAAGWVPG